MPLAPIPAEAFTKIAVGIDRPEDVVVSKSGRVFASDHQCAVAEIFPDGSFKRMGPKGGAPNGINLDPQGRILIANFGIYDREEGPLQRFDPATGAPRLRDNGAVDYPWHGWQAGIDSVPGQAYDIVAAFEITVPYAIVAA